MLTSLLTTQALWWWTSRRHWGSQLHVQHACARSLKALVVPLPQNSVLTSTGLGKLRASQLTSILKKLREQIILEIISKHVKNRMDLLRWSRSWPESSVTSVELLTTEKAWMYWSKSNTGPLRWLRDWRTWHTRRDWESRDRPGLKMKSSSEVENSSITTYIWWKGVKKIKSDFFVVKCKLKEKRQWVQIKIQKTPFNQRTTPFFPTPFFPLLEKTLPRMTVRWFSHLSSRLQLSCWICSCCTAVSGEQSFWESKLWNWRHHFKTCPLVQLACCLHPAGRASSTTNTYRGHSLKPQTTRRTYLPV